MGLKLFILFSSIEAGEFLLLPNYYKVLRAYKALRAVALFAKYVSFTKIIRYCCKPLNSCPRFKRGQLPGHSHKDTGLQLKNVVVNQINAQVPTFSGDV